MRMLRVTTGWAVAMCLAASMAWAAPKAAGAAAAKSSDVTGKIHSVDVVNAVVTLENGVFYVIPAAVKLDGFKAGDQVTISLEENDAHQAKTITKAN